MNATTNTISTVVDPELAIWECKVLFRYYLMGHKFPPNILPLIDQQLSDLKSYQPTVMLRIAQNNNPCEVAKRFVKQHFSQAFIDLFEQKITLTQVSNYTDQVSPNLLPALVAIFVDAYKNIQNQQEKERQQQIKWLQLAHDCLLYHGLHPNIFKREPSLHKRFNLVLSHTEDRKVVSSHRVLWTSEEFQKYFAIPYSLKRPIQLQGRLIVFSKIKQVYISTTLLQDDEIEIWANKKRFSWTDLIKDEIKFALACNDETEKYHPNPYAESIHPGVDWTLVSEIQQILKPYPAIAKLYESAEQKLRLKQFERNALDDLRLATELLLKELLKNQLSLENQLPALGQALKLKGGSAEITNMFQKVLDYFAKYNNTYIKHNDKVNEVEVDFMVNLTNILIRHLVKSLVKYKRLPK